MQTQAPRVPTLLTIPEAAARLGVSPDTIRRRIQAKELPAAKFAGKWRIRLTDVDALVPIEPLDPAA